MSSYTSKARKNHFEQLARLKPHPIRQPLWLWFSELEILYASVGIVDDSVKVFHLMTILENEISDAKLELLEFSLVFADKPDHGRSSYELLKEQMLSVYEDMDLKG
ncbi:GH17561 [Drosophila grimshawi]|uniref:GH17561 n=1 Tax=Drosophila grimshawi TaxID=7222 RepID=B4JXJ2_DROGR|nr:GH17561 [Drosophila grimshawi]